MNRKNRIKLGALSKIDDKILDRASEKRYSLLSRRRLQKVWIWAVAAAACLCLIVSGVLLIPLLGKQVPVYRGMTVSSTSPLAQLSTALPDTLDQTTLLTLSAPAGYSEAVFLKTDNPNANENGQISQKTEADIASSLQIAGTDKELYYAAPNQDIYITIHIDNPDQYEIQSFTLNGKKYSSYMFEAGSDMENLVLKINVGEVAGYVSYTVDAIKYIDGTEIKDVRFDGDRTVRVGVATDQQPTVTVTDERTDFTSISFAVTLTDPLSLIGTPGGKAGAVLLDINGDLLDIKLLSIGKNTVTFDGLTADTSYRFGVVLFYDDLTDEDGIALHIFYDKTVTTPRFLTMGATSVSQNSLSFSLLWGEGTVMRTVTAIELYRGAEMVGALATNATRVDGLLSNNTYTLRISYFSDAGNDLLEYTFTTEAKSAPTVTLSTGTVTQKSLSFGLTFTDPDSVGQITEIALLHGNDAPIIASSLDARSFSDLLSNNDYTVRVSYVYDLNDGNGQHSESKTLNLHTEAKRAPTFTLSSPSVTTTTASGNLSVTDADSTLIAIESVALYQGTVKVCDFGTDISFSATDLSSYTTYTLKITYSRDLSDGKGIISETTEIAISTPAVLQVTSIIPYNSDSTTNEISRLIIRLNNPSRVEISTIKINGISCEIDQALSSFNSLIVNLQKLEEVGQVTLRVTEISYDLYGIHYSEKGVSADASLNVFINQPIVFKSLTFVDSAGLPTDYCFPSSRAELLLEVSNPADYPITGVVINYTDITMSSITKVGDGLYRIALPADTSGALKIDKITLNYGNEHFSDSLTEKTNQYCIFLTSDTIRYISSVADLQAIGSSNHTYYYYQQTQDIDLNGLQWFGSNVLGVYDGNGYKIKNMQNIGAYGIDSYYAADLDHGNFGLFNSAQGVVKNVTLSNTTMILKFGDQIEMVTVGAFAGFVNKMLILENCTLEENCLFRLDVSDSQRPDELSATDVYVGSAYGRYYKIINCTDRSDYKLTVKEYE